MLQAFQIQSYIAVVKVRPTKLKFRVVLFYVKNRAKGCLNDKQCGIILVYNHNPIICLEVTFVHNKNVVEINLNALASNVTNLLAKYDQYDYYIGVVKGNAYGHGFGIVPTLIRNGVNYLAVSSLEEAHVVRKMNQNVPILIMEPVLLEEIEMCLAHRFTVTVSNFEYFEKLAQQPVREEGGPLKIHLKLDTGLNRLGIDDQSKLEVVYQQLKKREDFYLEGIFTHFATTGVTDPLFDRQVAAFLTLTENLDLSQIPVIHLGRSATLETREKLAFATGVRMGAIMYGINQTFRPYVGLKGKLRKVRDDYRKKKLSISDTYSSNDLEVTTTFALKTPVMEINRVYAGESVGYGGTFVAEKDTYIAVCPIGYADGLHLGLRHSHVAFHGKKFPIVGIVNMCMITVEVDATVKVGDLLTVLGDEVSLKKVAQLTQTTPYVGMTQVNKDIKRVYVGEETDLDGRL